MKWKKKGKQIVSLPIYNINMGKHIAKECKHNILCKANKYIYTMYVCIDSSLHNCPGRA